MEGYFRNKYRIDSTRLKYYDYASNGAYFITICTKKRYHYFGEIVDEKMILNNIGDIAKKCWLQIPNHFLNVKLDQWVIMPDHIHGIIVIQNAVTHNCIAVEAQNFAPLQNRYMGNAFGPQSKNLASIIRGFKIGVTKSTRQHLDINNIWQSRYYDIIIHNSEQLNNIRQYIINNPKKWKK